METSVLPTPRTNGELFINSSTAETPSRSGGHLGEFFSPGRKRLWNAAGKGSPIVSTEVMNDDQLEKREKLLESVKRKKITEARPIPLDQKKEHFYSCLKLAAENKINKKNAFNLHLIDYMDDILFHTEGVDFQLAALTVDAGSKIYSYRVDALHTEICVLSTTLNRMMTGDEKGKKNKRDDLLEEDYDDGEMNDGDAPMATKKKSEETTRRKHKKTIETNLKNITLNEPESNLEIDTHFRRMMVAFEPGNTSKLLLNTLHTWDDTGELILNPRRVVDSKVKEGQVQGQVKNKMVDISEFGDIFSHILKKKPQICPSLRDFKISEGEEGRKRSSPNKQILERFRLDPNSEPMAWPQDNALEPSDLPEAFDDDDHIGMTSHDLGVSAPPTYLEETLRLAMSRDVTAIREGMKDRPRAFNSFLERYLMGIDPDKFSSLVEKKEKDKEEERQKKRNLKKQKEDFLVMFDEEEADDSYEEKGKKKKKPKLTPVDLGWHFVQGRVTTRSSEKFLAQDTSEILLPSELTHDCKQFKQIFCMPEALVEVQPRKQTQNVDVSCYDYSNDNDVNNYCPDDRDASLRIPDVGDDNDRFPLIDNNDDIDDLPNDYDNLPVEDGNEFRKRTLEKLEEEMKTQEGAEMLIGNNLIPEPRKIPKLLIDYDKVAKNIDVRKLRQVMINTLSNSLETSNEITFSKAIDDMWCDLPKATKDDLSFHIALFCLLNITNEQNYVLNTNDDMSEILIVKPEC